MLNKIKSDVAANNNNIKKNHYVANKIDSYVAITITTKKIKQ
jgi:hypothetical protein